MRGKRDNEGEGKKRQGMRVGGKDTEDEGKKRARKKR